MLGVEEPIPGLIAGWFTLARGREFVKKNIDKVDKLKESVQFKKRGRS
jgi:hypothetical protein